LAWIALAIFLVAVILRIALLDRLPGINADEASYGLWANELLSGYSIQWRTPNGTLLNPFYIFPQIFVEAVAPRSFFSLRIVALSSGLIAVLFGWWSIHRRFGPISALAFLALAAALPMNLAYSRFGWDASQSFLFSLLTLHFAFRGRPIATALSSVSMVLVHPTNLFLLPFVLLALGLNTNWQRLARLGTNAKTAIVAVSVLLASAAMYSMVFLNPRIPSFVEMLLGSMLDRLFNPQHWLAYFQLSLAVGLLVFGLCRALRTRDAVLGCVMLGIPVLLVCGYLLHGPDVLAPHKERYAAYLLAPTLLAFSLAVGEVGQLGRGAARIALLSTFAIASTLLLSFWQHYFKPLLATGGEAQIYMRTAAVEPKALLTHHLESLAIDGDTKPTILLDSYWIAQPVHYLLWDQPGPTLVQLSSHKPMPFSDAELERWLDEHGLLVGFKGGRFDTSLESSGIANLHTQAILDPAGRPVIYLWQRTHPGSAHRPDQQTSGVRPARPVPRGEPATRSLSGAVD
jgi:hypothetical protein